MISKKKQKQGIKTQLRKKIVGKHRLTNLRKLA